MKMTEMMIELNHQEFWQSYTLLPKNISVNYHSF